MNFCAQKRRNLQIFKSSNKKLSYFFTLHTFHSLTLFGFSVSPQYQKGLYRRVGTKIAWYFFEYLASRGV